MEKLRKRLYKYVDTTCLSDDEITNTTRKETIDPTSFSRLSKAEQLRLSKSVTRKSL